MVWYSFVMIVGLSEYDPDGEKARALEESIGIKVIRHSKLRFWNCFVLFFLFAVDDLKLY